MKTTWVYHSVYRGCEIQHREPPTSRGRNWRVSIASGSAQMAEKHTLEECIDFVNGPMCLNCGASLRGDEDAHNGRYCGKCWGGNK